ncbi:MAG: carbohydrate-binding domain-containing protein [Brooklawnia sp.]|jgi:hypothetical protein
MRYPIWPAALLALALPLAGCAAETSEAGDPASGSVPAPARASASDFDLSPEAVMAENADYTTVNADEWDPSTAVDLPLAGSSSPVTISQAGVYRLHGSLTGQVRVEAGEDALVVLVLDGIDISSDAGAAIEVVSADDVAIHLAAGSSNTLSDAAPYPSDADANAAIHAASDLTISGDGELTVNGNGNDGITSTDDLVILGGKLAVIAADDALRGKDSLVVEGGTLQLTATAGDAMKSDGDDDEQGADWTRGYIYVRGGTINATAGDDGLQAFTDTVIASGAVTVAVADDAIKGEAVVSIGAVDGLDAPSVTVTDCEEGLEAANIGISAGVIDITANDDGINASGNGELQARIAGTEYVEQHEFADTGERLEITGGTVSIVAGFDGLDSNGTLTITGGQVDITAVERGGDGPVDANGSINVADGIVTANGSAWDAASAAMPGGPGGMGGSARGRHAPASRWHGRWPRECADRHAGAARGDPQVTSVDGCSAVQSQQN